jgi:hypothetical protein
MMGRASPASSAPVPQASVFQRFGAGDVLLPAENHHPEEGHGRD